MRSIWLHVYKKYLHSISTKKTNMEEKSHQDWKKSRGFIMNSYLVCLVGFCTFAQFSRTHAFEARIELIAIKYSFIG